MADRNSDEELLLGSLRGRRGDFRLLLERYEGELFNFLYHYVGDRQTAEDLFQETFLQVYAKMDTFRPDGRFKPWMYTIAANLARDASDGAEGRFHSTARYGRGKKAAWPTLSSPRHRSRRPFWTSRNRPRWQGSSSRNCRRA